MKKWIRSVLAATDWEPCFLPVAPSLYIVAPLRSCYMASIELLLFSCSVVLDSFCNPMDYSLPSSSVHGIFQARTLEWVAMPFSRGYSGPRDQTPVSCLAGRFITI